MLIFFLLTPKNQRLQGQWNIYGYEINKISTVIGGWCRIQNGCFFASACKSHAQFVKQAQTAERSVQMTVL